MPKHLDLTGQRFNRYVALRRAPDKGRLSQWECRCDCGTIANVFTSALRSGNSQSCGCRTRDVARGRKTIHGRSATPLYNIWQQMLARCENREHQSFKNYGGRGISVCPRWQSFENFAADMGERPSGMTIDRENNDGNYEPGNCRWATQKVQQSNKRTNVSVHIDGQVFRTLADAARAFGIRPVTVNNRISNYKWDIERALKTPLVKKFTPNRFKTKEV